MSMIKFLLVVILLGQFDPQTDAPPLGPTDQVTPSLSGCAKAGSDNCGSVPSPGTPCVDQECITDVSETVVKRYCKASLIPNVGRIGYYDIATTYPKAVSGEDQYDGTKVEIRKYDWYCWRQVGCPVASCTEAADPINPNVFRWYCSDPSQTGSWQGKQSASEPYGAACPTRPPVNNGGRKPPQQQVQEP